MFERKLFAGWGDMDFNAHMRNTAYLDKAVDVRMMFFAEAGFPMREFARLRVGPVVRKDEVEYYREVRLLEEVTVNLALAGMADDGSRFSVRNEFFLPGGELAARVTSLVGFLDLAQRKLVAAPAPLLQVLQALPHTPDFQTLPSSVR